MASDRSEAEGKQNEARPGHRSCHDDGLPASDGDNRARPEYYGAGLVQ